MHYDNGDSALDAPSGLIRSSAGAAALCIGGVVRVTQVGCDQWGKLTPCRPRAMGWVQSPLPPEPPYRWATLGNAGLHGVRLGNLVNLIPYKTY
jgi:hypothetical protein